MGPVASHAMLDLRRLRLLRELSERGTIAAVAEALQYTPSAVSQQLAILERETGVKLLERAGRGVRLTDAALVLVGHAEALLERAALAEAELAAASGTVAGRGRIAGFQSVLVHVALPAVQALAASAPVLHCELVEAEPEEALPALSLGDLDVVLGDEWSHAPWALSDALVREPLLHDPLRLVGASSFEELADAVWVSGHPGMTWEEVTRRICREHGGFEPVIRHRAGDATLALELVARGLAVTLLPELALRGAPEGLESVPVPGAERVIYATTRASDASRPSTGALLGALRTAARP
jgi:DNA-binding transcriptional LysR family regulator